MMALALNFLISTVVIVLGFAVSGELRHPSRDTLEAMVWLSIIAGAFMSLKDLAQSWTAGPESPEARDEDDFL